MVLRQAFVSLFKGLLIQGDQNLPCVLNYTQTSKTGGFLGVAEAPEDQGRARDTGERGAQA
eukprot:CAMPEP_0167792624 /NCGR_PEP_ID=MMETSP0111_2-20121227/12664_1 /TAXON_ID=91324 /ORGANISM="Lotharella globosa, Strain CCCM811" /LENGTH=60 /DNA_ID=CAMNT_0007685563 /DNA_START=493 /DNA_END=675 /DNA_ORIENTATION=+